MATIELKRLQDYWKTQFEVFLRANGQIRDRFLVILRCFHFAQNLQRAEPKPSDRLVKIRPVLHLLKHYLNRGHAVFMDN